MPCRQDATVALARCSLAKKSVIPAGSGSAVSQMSESNSTTSLRVVPALRSWGYSASRNLEGTWDPELGLHSAVTNLRVFMLVQQGACSLGSQFLSVPAGLSLLTLGKNTVSAQRQSCPSQHHAREVDSHGSA